MDILKDDKWFGQLQLSGIGLPINAQGTIIGINSQFLSAMRAQNPRTPKDGTAITILISRVPFNANKDDSTKQKLLHQLESTLDKNNSTGGPFEDEGYDSFVLRLMSCGATLEAAKFVADDWFDMHESDPMLISWMEDGMAIRFRQLNSSNSAYESALPGEYERLKQYVLNKFPKQCEAIVFRTA